MAAIVAPSSSFSPLTLFESTITNANMLLDSMVLTDLVAALRIIGGLYGRVVEIMEPGVGTACAVMAADRLRQQQQQQQQQQQRQQEASGTSSTVAKRLKCDPGAVHVKPEFKAASSASLLDSSLGNTGEDYFNEDGDGCILIDDEYDEAFAAHSRPKLPSTALTGGADSAAGVDSASVAKQLLRTAYKTLRGAGPHLFDFTRQWNDAVNLRVTDRLIEHISVSGSFASSGISIDELRRQIKEFVVSNKAVENNKRSCRRYGRMQAKLCRRQKAFEQVLPSLTPDELDKYRTVLSRDFTSSDEETAPGAADEDSSADGGGAGGGGGLRVRELVWESEAVKQVKQRLDTVFVNRFATQKQRVTLQKCFREPGCYSNRGVPADAPGWAVKID